MGSMDNLVATQVNANMSVTASILCQPEQKVACLSRIYRLELFAIKDLMCAAFTATSF